MMATIKSIVIWVMSPCSMGKIVGCLFNAEDKVSAFARKIGRYLLGYMTSVPEDSNVLLWYCFFACALIYLITFRNWDKIIIAND